MHFAIEPQPAIFRYGIQRLFDLPSRLHAHDFSRQEIELLLWTGLAVCWLAVWCLRSAEFPLRGIEQRECDSRDDGAGPDVARTQLPPVVPRVAPAQSCRCRRQFGHLTSVPLPAIGRSDLRVCVQPRRVGRFPCRRIRLGAVTWDKPSLFPDQLTAGLTAAVSCAIAP